MAGTCSTRANPGDVGCTSRSHTMALSRKRGGESVQHVKLALGPTAARARNSNKGNKFLMDKVKRTSTAKEPASTTKKQQKTVGSCRGSQHHCGLTFRLDHSPRKQRHPASMRSTQPLEASCQHHWAPYHAVGGVLTFSSCPDRLAVTGGRQQGGYLSFLDPKGAETNTRQSNEWQATKFKKAARTASDLD